jgi:hypothetical protein
MQRKKIKKNNGGRSRKRDYALANNSIFSSVQKPLFGFINPRILTTLRYSTQLTRVITTLNGDQYLFNLISIFDPDVTGTGHQPYGRDTLALIYNRYRVLKFMYRVLATANGCTHLVTVMSNGALNANITNQTTFSAATETPYSQRRMIPFSAARTVTSSGSIMLNQLAGVTKVQYESDDRFQAVFSADPSELMLLTLGAYNPNTSTVTVEYQIELIYEIEAFDPIIQAQS